MNTATTTPPTGLESLAAEAQASMNEPPLGQGTTDLDAAYAGEAPPISNQQAIAGALAAGREAFCLFTKLQSPKQTLDDATCDQLSAVWAKVLDKRGIQLSKYMGDYAAEIAAAMATFAVAKAVHGGVQAELAARRSETAEPPAADSTADGSAQG
jgi:hypothetical protein